MDQIRYYLIFSIMYRSKRMSWTEEWCICNRGMTSSKAIEFKINGSRIELRCKTCTGLVGWWHGRTKKIMPFKRIWSDEECQAMR
jgi:hypothetical protein